jgi:hypothetical protein
LQLKAKFAKNQLGEFPQKFSPEKVSKRLYEEWKKETNLFVFS